MSVRAKFTVSSVEENGKDAKTIRLQPVYDGSAENKAFFKATPGGSIELYCVNPAASDQFVKGKEYYVDFTLA